MRIGESANPLDKTAVNPESYPLVEKMAEDLGVTVRELMHISQLRDGYMKNPTDVVKARKRVTVKVLDVDLEWK